MKKTLKRVLWLLIILIILLPLSLFLVLKTDWGRQYATKQVSSLLSKELGVPVSIGEISIRPFKTVALNDVLVLDHEADTLLRSSRIHADIGLFTLGGKTLHISELLLEEGKIKLVKHKGSADLNIMRIINGISSEDESQSSWDVQLNQIELVDFALDHLDENESAKGPGKFDASHLRFTNLNGGIEEIAFLEKGVSLYARNLTAQEASGLELKSLDSHFTVDGQVLEIEGMSLKTRSSDLIGDVRIDFSQESTDDLELEVLLSSSKVQLSELGYFVQGYESIQEDLFVSTDLRGTLDDLRLQDTYIEFGRDSHIRLDGDVKGLPDIDSLWLDVRIRELSSSVDQLAHLPVPGMSEQVEKLPAEAFRLGDVTFSGDFIGYLQDFKAEGSLRTDLGSAQAGLDVYISDISQSNRYRGRLELEKMDLGQLLEDPELGKMSCRLDMDLSGHGKQLSADLKGEVSSLTYKGYTYRNLEVDGTLEERLFNGFLSIQQPEIDMDFNGLVDLRSEIPRFRFEAEVFQADVSGLGLTTGLDSTSITGRVRADFRGDDIDRFLGKVEVENLSYCAEGEEFFFNDIRVEAVKDSIGRTVSLDSEMLDARISGSFNYTELPQDFMAMFRDVIPSFYMDDEAIERHGSNIDFQVELKDAERLTSLFLPDLQVAQGTALDGKLDADSELLSFHLRTDTIIYRFVSLLGLDMEMVKDDEVSYVALETVDMQWGDSLRFRDNFYTFNAYQDSVEIDFTWTLVDKDASGSISALAVVHSPDSITGLVYPSQMVMSGDYWMTEGDSRLTYHDGEFQVDDARLSNGKELLLANGRIGRDQADRLEFDVQDFQLDHINKFLPKDMVDLDGITELKGYATALLGKPTIVAELSVGDFSLGGERIGNLDLSSTWNRGKEFLEISGQLENKGIKEIVLDGRYFPSAETDNLDAALSFEGFHLAILNKIPTGGIDGIGGRATGTLSVKGAILEPDINGELAFTDASIRIGYLNTRYFFNDKVVVRKDYIGTNYIPFRDEFGNTGFLNGTVAHQNYRDWNYDVYAEFTKMLVLDTDASMNPRFYGKVFGSGSVSIFGFDQNLTIEILGKTEAGTTLDLPLGNTEEVVLEDYIYFKSAVKDSTGTNERAEGSTVELYMEAETTPDAQIRLVFDEKIGDVMQGRGMGTLTMTMDRSGTLEVFGNYTITEGDYLFTLQNVVNKRFSVETGSTVSFYGDPFKAELDLTASYNLRASLADLLSNQGLSYGNRVPVECQMQLKGELFNPDIGFQIEFPGLEPGLETMAQSKLDTEEELNRQVFSLLVLNKFLSSEPTDATAGISAATTTFNEFASSQLSNWLSQISEDVDVGVNYRSGDNINSEELAVALTTQLFNDRLLLTGNFGVQNAPSSAVERASSVIGDFRLEYILTKDGKLRLKVFNETNDYSFLNVDQAATKQGVGLVFQREFDGLFDDGKLKRTP